MLATVILDRNTHCCVDSVVRNQYVDAAPPQGHSVDRRLPKQLEKRRNDKEYLVNFSLDTLARKEIIILPDLV